MKISDSTLIDILGGSSEVAKACCVSSAAVSQWRKKGIPKARMMYLKIKYPKIFKQLNNNENE